MSKKEKQKKASGLPRAASKRRKERAARDAASAPPPSKPDSVPAPEPRPAPPPAPGLKRPDPLEDFLKSEEKAKEVKAAAPCQHKHMAFTKMGAVLKCIDCKAEYHKMLQGGGVPDVGYFNASITDLDTRHTPYEAPRITPNS